MNVKLRLYGFALAVVLLATLTGWAGHSAWRQLTRLRISFGAVQRGSFHLADRVEASIQSLSETARRFEMSKDPADKALFRQEAEALKQAIHKSSATTPGEVDLLTRIEVALEAYLTRTIDPIEEGTLAGSVPSLRKDLEGVGNKSQILDLVAKLKAAEQVASGGFVGNSQRALGGLQRLLAALVALVLISGFTATSLIYRVRIAPLRAQLVESRAIIDRQEKLASLGTLAAGVAHEIRNPLTAINVRLHSLKRTLVRGSSEEEDAGVIDKEIQRLDRIVRDFLHFARPAEPRSVTLTAESLFSRVQGLLGSQLAKNSIRLNLAPSATQWIRVDPQQIEQVLINLIQNAAESIRREGTVTLRARSTLMSLSGHTIPVVILEVIDTGKGIPLKVQERLFDPFFTTKEAGTGLGLSIAARIVEKHGGALQYQTKVDRGTTFGIVLPRVEENEHEGATENPTH